VPVVMPEMGGLNAIIIISCLLVDIIYTFT